MFGKLFDSNEKQINKMRHLVDKILSYEKEYEKLSKDEIQQKTKNGNKN